MLSAITNFSASPRGKWITIGGWLVAAAVLVAITPGVNAVLDNDSFSSVPSDAETVQVQELVDERFPTISGGAPAIIVFRNPDGLSEANLAEIERLSSVFSGDDAPNEINGVISIFTQPEAAEGLRSADGTTMTMIVNVRGSSLDSSFNDAVNYLRDEVSSVDGLQAAVTGPAGIGRDLASVFENINTVLTLASVILVLMLLIIIYRSPVVAVVPILAVAWVLTVAGAIASVVLQWLDLPANAQAQGIMTVLLFGAGTDYCLFISSRFREELRQVDNKHEAMRRTMSQVGASIASSAGTVFVATIALLFAVVPNYRALGPLISVAILVLLVAGLTLIPAVLTVLGRFAFWPFRPAFDPSADTDAAGVSGLWSWIANLVRAHPRRVLMGTIAFFLLTSLPLLRAEWTFDQVAALPTDAESREGFELLRQGFPDGELSPTEVYIAFQTEGAAMNPATLAQIDELTITLAEYPGIASVSGPSRPFGADAPVGPEEIQAAAEAVAAETASPEQRALFGQSMRFLDADVSAVRLELVLADNPFGVPAIEDVPDLRAEVTRLGEETGLTAAGAELLVGGETATAFDSKTGSDRDTFVLIPVILLAIGIILGLLLRSVVAPVYLVATIIVSFFGTLGIGVFFFEFVFGQAGLGSAIPFLSFVFIAALGVDYNIYLTARIREESRQHGLEEGTVRALSRTGSVITSAGIILAGTFSVLMLLPLQDLFQLGFVVAIGVLIDTFITRSLMVPSIVLLLGRWNWWPSDDLTASAPHPKPPPSDEQLGARHSVV